MNMRMKRRFAIPFSVLVGMLAGVGALAQGSPANVEGEVVQVMQQTRAGEPGSLDAVMIRTRQGEQVRLLLGEPGSCEGCVQVGDRVRARLSKNGASMDGYQVRSMKVQRTGERTRFRDASGELLRLQSRDRTQDGTALNDGARSRDRIHQPGTGSSGAGGRGSRSGGGNGGRQR